MYLASKTTKRWEALVTSGKALQNQLKKEPSFSVICIIIERLF